MVNEERKDCNFLKDCFDIPSLLQSKEVIHFRALPLEGETITKKKWSVSYCSESIEYSYHEYFVFKGNSNNILSESNFCEK